MNTRITTVCSQVFRQAGLAAALLMMSSIVVTAVAGESVMQQKQCVQCHDLSGPAPTTFEDLQARKGPDLFYAGNKYRREWLEQWLQDPVRIRPAGMFFANHVEHRDGLDQLMPETLVDHPALEGDEAARVADYLMGLSPNDHLVNEGEYQAGSIGLNMGEMLFDRFRGCLSCHEIEPGYGGLSGPEVYTAAARLQPDFMISYMRNPQAWDPMTFMPARRLSDNDLQRLVHYFRALKEEFAQ